MFERILLEESVKACGEMPRYCSGPVSDKTVHCKHLRGVAICWAVLHAGVENQQKGKQL
jgi:hypothetical protein